MDVNGQEMFEDSTPEKKGERSFMPQASSAIRTFQRYARSLGAAIDEEDIFKCAKALVGYQVVRSEVVGVTTRKWIERGLPFAHGGVSDPDINPTGLNILRCQGVPRVWPMTGHMENDDSILTPRHAKGVFFQARFGNFPFFFFEDSVAAANTLTGPLAAGTPATAVARPDEGKNLQLNGWAGSRYVGREIIDANRTITLPGGFVLYADADIAANTPVIHGMPYVQYKKIIKYTHYQVPIAGVPWTYMSKVGTRTNISTFDFAPAGTLLYVSSAVKQYQGPLYDWLADVTHTFAFLPNWDSINSAFGGWNSVPVMASVGGNKKIKMAKVSADGAAPTGTNALFPPDADFSGLFRPDQS